MIRRLVYAVEIVTDDDGRRRAEATIENDPIPETTKRIATTYVAGETSEVAAAFETLRKLWDVAQALRVSRDMIRVEDRTVPPESSEAER